MKIYSLISIAIIEPRTARSINSTTRLTTTSYKEVKEQYKELSDFRVNRYTKLYGGKVIRKSPMTTEMIYTMNNKEILQITKIIEHNIDIPEL